MSTTNFVNGQTPIVADWLNDVDAHVYDQNTAHDSTHITYNPQGTGSVATTVQSKLREEVSVFDFMTAAEIADVTSRAATIDVTAKIQVAIDAVRDGVVLIPGGEYRVNSDLVLLNKGRAPEEGALWLEATGAFFVGTGRVVVNSCKRVQINGLDMANMDLVMRGCWWGQFSNLRFKRLHINDAAGTDFSSNYWNQFQQCQFQTVLTDAASTSPSNEFAFESCSMRGNVGQGFSSTAAYAFEFNANQNCQAWKFNNGDISYHTTEIYNVGGANTSGDIELLFDGTYFDTNLPAQSDRDKSRIHTKNCHHANGAAFISTLTKSTFGHSDVFNTARGWKHDASTSFNLIPNGDFSQRLTTWSGAGRPIGNLNSASLAVVSGGISGNVLRITQSLTTSNAVRFKSKALPYGGRITGTIVLRNADAGSKSLLVQIGGYNPPVTINDTEWTVVRLTASAAYAAGATPEILVYTADSTAFNVDVAYVAYTLGEGGSVLVPSTPNQQISVEVVYDPPSIAAAAETATDFTVTGAEVGDFVIVSPGTSIGQLTLAAPVVIAADTVRIRLKNNTVSAIDIASSTWRVLVIKSRAYV